MAPGTYPSGAAPPGQPVKLGSLPEIVFIGAWRGYGFAKSGDGTIWLWQGVENRYAALTDEELAAAIGILAGNTPPQDTPKIARHVSNPITHENLHYLACEFYRGFIRKKARYGIPVCHNFYNFG
jgi:hypothetical protein